MEALAERPTMIGDADGVSGDGVAKDKRECCGICLFGAAAAEPERLWLCFFL